MSMRTGETAVAVGTHRQRALVTVLCWLAAALPLGGAVVRLAGLDRGPLVQAIAFTPYLAALAPLAVVPALALRRGWPAGLAALAAVALLAVVVPRALPDRQPAAAGPPLRVLTANLLFGRADPAALVSLVRTLRVDVLALQEFTPQAQAGLDRHGLADLLPYRQLNPEVSTRGSALYARHPLRDGGVRRNAGGFTQAYATLDVPGGPPVLVESAHPMAPATLAQLGNWRTDLDAQPRATPAGPVRILAGDFNATLDHAPLRGLVRSGYADAADRVGAGLVGTWGPYDGDPIPPVTIDHVLVDRRVAVRDVSVHPLPRSDHRAVLADLRLPAG